MYDWRGSPFEIGLQHGKALRDGIVREAGSALASLARQRQASVERTLEFVKGLYAPVFRDHVPAAVEEIEGISRGSGLSFAHAFFAATRDGMRPPAGKWEGCTAIACGRPVTEGGKVIIAQNKDTCAPLDRYHITRLAYASGRRAILLNYPGWIANVGLTSDGLSFAGTSLYAESSMNGCLPFSLLKRLIIEKKSVREFLESIRGLVFENCCILVGDATGHIVCLEQVNGRREVRDVSSLAFGHANSILGEELKPFECAERVSEGSPIRQRNVQHLLERTRGQLTVEAVKSILADHADHPWAICRHGPERGGEATTASFVSNLTDLEIEIAIGNPCAAEFVRYTMDF